ncbi:MAG TPA: hypothetical protein VN887_08250 [Candidatus Angelobacter sp.]|nr:hypothetical protein [Candidatus Angelobacter sp.]
MKTSRFAIFAILVLASSASIVRAQMPAGGPPGWNAALTRLFGDVKAFSARTDVRQLDKAGKEMAALTMDFALLEGDIRVEFDLAHVKGGQISPAAVAQMKQLGMDRTVAILQPTTRVMRVIYPRLEAYVDMPLPEDAAATDKNFKIEKVKLGNEKIDGHSCVKHRVIMTDGRGGKAEALVWNATDLKDFPIQMQMNENESTVVMRYKQIQLARPEARQFQPPTGYKKHADVQQLMMAAAQRQMSGQRGKK